MVKKHSLNGGGKDKDHQVVMLLLAFISGGFLCSEACSCVVSAVLFCHFVQLALVVMYS